MQLVVTYVSSCNLSKNLTLEQSHLPAWFVEQHFAESCESSLYLQILGSGKPCKTSSGVPAMASGVVEMYCNLVGEDAAAESRLYKRDRWLRHIRQSEAYRNVRAVLAGQLESDVPLTPPCTPTKSARSKRLWEKLCQRFRHKLLAWNSFIYSNPELLNRVQVIREQTSKDEEIFL